MDLSNSLWSVTPNRKNKEINLTSETSSRRSPDKGNDAGTGKVRGGGSGGTAREQG